MRLNRRFWQALILKQRKFPLTDKKEFDTRNEQNIIEAVRHSDIVYNLIGRAYETK